MPASNFASGPVPKLIVQMRLEGGWLDRSPVRNPERTDAGALIKNLSDVTALMKDGYTQKVVFQLGRLTASKCDYVHDRVQEFGC